MKHLLTLSLSLCLIFTATAQTKTSTNKQTLINNLVNNLQDNPDNPLKVDKQLLVNVANAIPDGGLKNKLLSYGANLGTDQNLSMRQVYYDLNSAFSNNAKLASSFAQTGRGLDILMNNPEQLVNSIKDKIKNYQPGVFMNDPEMMNNLRLITKSEAGAQGLGLAAEFATAFINDAKAAKAFKNDYKTYAEISNRMLYLETDKNLRRALIDACVGKNPFSMITPVYRYDFDNGAALAAENGILTYTNGAKKINLFAIENRNNGITKDGSSLRAYINDVTDPKNKVYPHPQFMFLTPDQKKAFFTTGIIQTENECSSCLKENLFYVMDTETGELIEKPDYKFIDFSQFLEFSLGIGMVPSKPLTPEDMKTGNFHLVPGVMLFPKSIASGSVKGFDYSSNPADLKPVIDNFMGKQAFKNGLSSSLPPYTVAINWDMKKKDQSILTSSVLSVIEFKPPTITYEKKKTPKIVDNSKYYSAMVNKFTGAVVDKNKILYYTTASGNAGKVDLNITQPDDANLEAKMKEAEVAAGLATYNFSYGRKYLFESAGFDNYYNLPSLTLTPDEKNLIYIIGNNLYIFDINNMASPKKFTLTIEPYNYFYGRENGEPTIYFQAFNDFKFPIIKKYALNKLINAPIVAEKIVAAPPATVKEAAKTAPASVADELKKLKALMNDGTLTKAEFEAAKKKLLYKN